MEITKEEAKEAWNNLMSDEDTKILLEMKFDDFDAYWEDCEKFNNLSLGDQKEQKRVAMDKLKINL